MPNKKLTPLILLTLTLLGLAGCDAPKDSPPKSAPAPASDPKPDTVHAGPEVVPGSHEDWCGEHQVPESLCSRCNPSLIAAFKATGDWCGEHGLPESQCLLCNPDTKIERPPAAAP